MSDNNMLACACCGACRYSGKCMGIVMREVDCVSQEVDSVRSGAKATILEFFGKAKNIGESKILRFRDTDVDGLMSDIDQTFEGIEREGRNLEVVINQANQEEKDLQDRVRETKGDAKELLASAEREVKAVLMKHNAYLAKGYSGVIICHSVESTDGSFDVTEREIDI